MMLIPRRWKVLIIHRPIRKVLIIRESNGPEGPIRAGTKRCAQLHRSELY